MIEISDQAHFMWEKGWAGHEKAQLLRMAELSFEKKIRWLEEAQELIHAFQQNWGLPPHTKNVTP
jgi:hypothetical protein